MAVPPFRGSDSHNVLVSAILKIYFVEENVENNDNYLVCQLYLRVVTHYQASDSAIDLLFRLPV